MQCAGPFLSLYIYACTSGGVYHTISFSHIVYYTNRAASAYCLNYVSNSVTQINVYIRRFTSSVACWSKVPNSRILCATLVGSALVNSCVQCLLGACIHYRVTGVPLASPSLLLDSMSCIRGLMPRRQYTQDEVIERGHKVLECALFFMSILAKKCFACFRETFREPVCSWASPISCVATH